MPCSVLLISGSLRSGSTNSAVMRTAADVAGEGMRTATYDALGSLPHFNPDDDPDGGPIPDPVREMREAMDAVDAILVSTPEYAGALPGSFKNALEWTIGGAQTYGKPVAWINSSGSAAPTGAADAHESLRKVLTYAGAEIVEDACVRIPVARRDVGEDGLIADLAIRAGIRASLDALCAHVDAGEAASDE